MPNYQRNKYVEKHQENKNPIKYKFEYRNDI